MKAGITSVPLTTVCSWPKTVPGTYYVLNKYCCGWVCVWMGKNIESKYEEIQIRKVFLQESKMKIESRFTVTMTWKITVSSAYIFRNLVLYWKYIWFVDKYFKYKLIQVFTGAWLHISQKCNHQKEKKIYAMVFKGSWGYWNQC